MADIVVVFVAIEEIVDFYVVADGA